MQCHRPRFSVNDGALRLKRVVIHFTVTALTLHSWAETNPYALILVIIHLVGVEVVGVANVVAVTIETTEISMQIIECNGFILQLLINVLHPFCCSDYPPPVESHEHEAEAEAEEDDNGSGGSEEENGGMHMRAFFYVYCG